jgi:hypothetical protein
VRELHADSAFDIQLHITKEFFAEVFLSLSNGSQVREYPHPQMRRNTIARHFQEYVDITGFRRMLSCGDAHQISQYQDGDFKAMSKAFFKLSRVYTGSI